MANQTQRIIGGDAGLKPFPRYGQPEDGGRMSRMPRDWGGKTQRQKKDFVRQDTAEPINIFDLSEEERRRRGIPLPGPLPPRPGVQPVEPQLNVGGDRTTLPYLREQYEQRQLENRTRGLAPVQPTPSQQIVGGAGTNPAYRQAPVPTPGTAFGGQNVQYGQPQQPWRQLPQNLPMVPWYQNMMSGQALPSWVGPSNLPIPSAQAWRGMMPSEQQGYYGLAQTMGAYGPDVQSRMQQLHPSWMAPSMSGRMIPWR